jgi:acyl-coenzyme A thioesterase PaaI-like protein
VRERGPAGGAIDWRRVTDRRPVPSTHRAIDRRLCGEPVELAAGLARVRLLTRPEMAADERGLVHGGFLFGLADHAAMLAVNDPNVVLGAAETKFLKPCAVGDSVEATARLEGQDGRKRRVVAEVRRGDELLMTGSFTCFVLDRHVLD